MGHPVRAIDANSRKHTRAPILPGPPLPACTRAFTDFGVYAELPGPDYVTFVFGPGSTVEHGQRLTEALRHVAL